MLAGGGRGGAVGAAASGALEAFERVGDRAVVGVECVAAVVHRHDCGGTEQFAGYCCLLGIHQCRPWAGWLLVREVNHIRNSGAGTPLELTSARGLDRTLARRHLVLRT